MITARDWYMVGGGESGWLAPDPNDPNILYASGVYGGVRPLGSPHVAEPGHHAVAYAELRTAKSMSANIAIPGRPCSSSRPLEKNTLYLGTQYVMKTTDGGLHWQQISPDLTGAARERQRKAWGRRRCRTRRSGALAWCSASRRRR